LRKTYVGLIDPELLRELGRGIARLERFDEPAKVESELREAGFRDIEVVEHQIEFVFGDERQWWDWNWSHGGRVFLEALPSDALERYTPEAEAAMQQLRDERGFPRTYTALFARAAA
jgi:hypothetical protein